MDKSFCFIRWKNGFIVSVNSFCYIEAYEAQVCKQEDFFTVILIKYEKSIWQYHDSIKLDRPCEGAVFATKRTGGR